jgi:antitoxin VapB
MYMAIHIQDPETDRLARELSAVTGETITQAVNASLRERLRTFSPAVSEEEYIARIEKISDRLAALPVLDDRTPDEIIGYNEQGHFDS